jgi:hypothetical protein
VTTLETIAPVMPPLARRRAPGGGTGSVSPSHRRVARRLSPGLYKAVLASHILVSVGWLGTAFAKLVLGLLAVAAGSPTVSASLYLATGAVNVAFPPLAIATMVSGVALSLGTRWGLLRHYWVATKITLTVGVIVTAVQIGGRLQQSVSAPSGPVLDGGTILGIASAPVALLLALGVAHVLMLGVATVISVYKPWGKTWFARPSRD